MHKLNFLTILIIVFSGCEFLDIRESLASDKNEVNFKVSITVEGESLIVKYIVTNNFKKDIWICQDVDAYNRFVLPATLKIDKGTLIISLKRWEVPDYVIYEEWPVTKYTRLRKGESIEKELIFQLPVSDRNRYIDSKKVVSQTQVVLKKIIFELGFYLEDLSKLKGEHSKYDSKTDTAYVHYFWKNVKKEKNLAEIIEDISIPAIIKECEK